MCAQNKLINTKRGNSGERYGKKRKTKNVNMVGESLAINSLGVVELKGGEDQAEGNKYGTFLRKETPKV